MPDSTFKLGDKEYTATAGLRDAYKEVAGIIKAHGGEPPETVNEALQQLEKMDLGTALKQPGRRPGR